MKIYISLSPKACQVQISLKSDKNICYYILDISIFMIIFLEILLNMRNISGMRNLNTHFLFHVFLSEHRALHEIIWKIYGRSRHTINGYVIRCMGFECWIPKAIDIHSKYVILLLFHKTLLRERTSVLICMFISCYVSHPYFPVATSHFRILSRPLPSSQYQWPTHTYPYILSHMQPCFLLGLINTGKWDR
jgi:hypothetical protein